VHGAEIQRVALEALRQQFRPEFLNRIDEIVVYHRLGQEQIRSIVDIQLERLRARLARRELSIKLTPAAKDWLAAVGWDVSYGARPLKRAIVRYLEDPLASQILTNRFTPGVEILVDVENEQLSFRSSMPN
jgi:ATP-dependent Clp protease ATP-binding subunit ClpB